VWDNGRQIEIPELERLGGVFVLVLLVVRWAVAKDPEGAVVGVVVVVL
jgi:hypothetical protein